VVSVAVGCASQKEASTKKKSVIYVAADKASSRNRRGWDIHAVLWGDPDKVSPQLSQSSRRGTKRFAHSYERCVDNLSKALSYKDDAGEKRVGRAISASPGRPQHSSVATSGRSVFYEEGSGKFDLIPVK